jgi:hypothetical protein
MKYLACVTLAALVSFARANEPKTDLPCVSFAPFPLPLARTYVSPAAGTPAGKAELNSPFPDDFPPSLTIDLEDTRGYKTPKGAYAFLSHNTFRVYQISEIQKAPYKTIQGQLKALQKILKDRPAAVPNDPNTINNLPDYPSRNAAHAFELHLYYIDAAWGSGICYMTLFTQDGSNHANNDELEYLFQGLSKDGSFYVSADFHITHPRLNHWRAPESEKGDYSADIKLLSALKESSFIPKLPELYKWLMSIKLK